MTDQIADKSSQDIVLHLGYQKAASSWLQSVFHQTPSITYLMDNERFSQFFHDRILPKDPSEFDSIDTGKIWKELIQTARSETPGVLMATHDSLMGDFFEATRATPQEVIRRLVALEENFKLIIAIRRQDTLLWSIYSHYLRRGGTCSLKNFLDKGDTEDLFDNLHYDRAIRPYSKYFGKKNIYIFVLEDLHSDREKCLCDLLNFIHESKYSSVEEFGIKSSANLWEKVNTSIPREIHSVVRLLNSVSNTQLTPKGISRFLWRVNGFIQYSFRTNGVRNATVWRIVIFRLLKYLFWKSTDWKSTDSGIGSFAKRYSESNRRLDKEYADLGLAGYGYLDLSQTQAFRERKVT